MSRPAWYSVACADCGLSYDQQPGPAGDGRGPLMCGSCGSLRIRVVQHVVLIDNLHAEEGPTDA
jgi:hypothetical protein